MAKARRNKRLKDKPMVKEMVKEMKIVRVPKDQCPYCDEDYDIINNGYDVIHRGTDQKKRIPRYLCKNCGKTFRERNYISPSHLMTRQAAILWLLGYDYKTIAKQLNIEPTTAQSYVVKLINYKEAVLVRKTENEKTPITENKIVIKIPILKKWTEPKEGNKKVLTVED